MDPIKRISGEQVWIRDGDTLVSKTVLGYRGTDTIIFLERGSPEMPASDCFDTINQALEHYPNLNKPKFQIGDTVYLRRGDGFFTEEVIQVRMENFQYVFYYQEGNKKICFLADEGYLSEKEGYQKTVDRLNAKIDENKNRMKELNREINDTELANIELNHTIQRLRRQRTPGEKGWINYDGRLTQVVVVSYKDSYDEDDIVLKKYPPRSADSSFHWEESEFFTDRQELIDYQIASYKRSKDKQESALKTNNERLQGLSESLELWETYVKA